MAYLRRCLIQKTGIWLISRQRMTSAGKSIGHIWAIFFINPRTIGLLCSGRSPWTRAVPSPGRGRSPPQMQTMSRKSQLRQRGPELTSPTAPSHKMERGRKRTRLPPKLQRDGAGHRNVCALQTKLARKVLQGTACPTRYPASRLEDDRPSSV